MTEIFEYGVLALGAGSLTAACVVIVVLRIRNWWRDRV